LYLILPLHSCCNKIIFIFENRIFWELRKFTIIFKGSFNGIEELSIYFNERGHIDIFAPKYLQNRIEFEFRGIEFILTLEERVDPFCQFLVLHEGI